MMNLERFFEIQFNDVIIIRERLRKFVEDHLQRLSVQNTANQYDQMITDTQAVYESFFGAIQDKDTRFSLQQSRTKSMNNVMESFKKAVSLREGLIKNYFNADSPEYQEFFPYGRTEYHDASLENIETLLNRMVTYCTAHTAVLGSSIVTEFTTYKTKFLTARGDQLQVKGQVSDALEAAAQHRNALEIQLTKNVLTIALAHIGNKNAASMFFDQSIIKTSATANETPAPPPNN